MVLVLIVLSCNTREPQTWFYEVHPLDTAIYLEMKQLEKTFDVDILIRNDFKHTYLIENGEKKMITSYLNLKEDEIGAHHQVIIQWLSYPEHFTLLYGGIFSNGLYFNNTIIPDKHYPVRIANTVWCRDYDSCQKEFNIYQAGQRVSQNEMMVVDF